MALALLTAKLVRSIERGMGPSVLKDAFKVEDLGPKMNSEGGQPRILALDEVVKPEYMVLCGAWWFTRGIEASAAKRRDVRIDTERQEVSWNLPVSKRDPKALGEERTHGCMCAEHAGSALCPFHTMK